jgi:DNA-binding transcriptional ArsR family regulator
MGMTDDELDEALRALAHPARRAIVRVAAMRPLPAGQVAGALGVAPATASQHLRLLRRTGLVDVTTDGARRLYLSVPARAREVAAALLDRLTPPLPAERAGPRPGPWAGPR